MAGRRAVGSCVAPRTDAQRIAHRYTWHALWPRAAVFAGISRPPKPQGSCVSPQDRCADDCVSLRRHRPHAPRGIAWNGNAEFQVFPPLLLRCSSGRHGDEAGTAKRRQWQPRVRVAGKAPRRKTLGDVSDLNCQTDAGKAHTNPGRQLQIRWADCRAAAHGSGSHADGQGSERAAKYDDVDDFVVVRAPSFHRDQQLSPHRGQPTHGMPPAH